MSVIKYALNFYWQNYKKVTLLKKNLKQTEPWNPQNNKINEKTHLNT